MDAAAIIRRACRRHGPSLPERPSLHIQLRVEQLGGAIPRGKGLGRSHPQPDRVSVEPRRGRCTFHDYPAAGSDVLYERGSITSNQVERTGYRRRFRGLRKLRRWSPEDTAYFFGYAMVHYLDLPFSLVGRTPVKTGRCRDKKLGRGRESTWLAYDYPSDADTHSRRQTYYFADDGLLVRHDYRADVIGPLFRGAHYSDEYVDVGGLTIARRRRVFARLGRRATPIEVLHAHFSIQDVTTLP